ncbi:hypothetical protein MK280_03085 [Myxococcota bacterium]|nr:hypothetical protein [Myxococcota bacterium]
MKKIIPYIVGAVAGLIVGFSFALSMGAGTSKPKAVALISGNFVTGSVLFDDGSIWIISSGKYKEKSSVAGPK